MTAALSIFVLLAVCFLAVILYLDYQRRKEWWDRSWQQFLKHDAKLEDPTDAFTAQKSHDKTGEEK